MKHYRQILFKVVTYMIKNCIKNEDDDLIFTNSYSAKPNQRLNMFKPSDNIGKNILKFFKDNKVFYQDNITGEIVNNYKEWCLGV